MTSRGVVAVGDSITNSCGFPTGNLPLATWAQWVARAIGEPVTTHARSGASTDVIRADLLPEVDGEYRLGLVYCGSNDLLRGRPVEQYVADLDEILARVAKVCDTVLTFTPPLWVGRVPTVAPYGRRLRRVYAYGAAIRAVAEPLGVQVVQAPELSGPRFVAADRVHPTAAGQLAFADAAVWRLRDLGWDVPLPSSLVAAPDPVSTHDRRVWVAGTAQAMVEAPLRQLVRIVR